MRTRSLVFPLAALFLVPLLAAPADAGGGPRDHQGFFLRLSGGFGYGRTSASDGGSTLRLSGASGDGNFAIGGAVSENLILHGTLFGWSVTDPDVDLDGAGGTINGTLSLGAVGGGLTHYIMPANLYLSGSIGLAQLEFEGGETDIGFAFDATFGKEWWVGNSWGLGLAGGFGYHTVPEDGVDLRWNDLTLHLRFSATLN